MDADWDLETGGRGWRLLVCFALLALIPGVVIARLWNLQVSGGVTIQRQLRENGTQPAPLVVGLDAARRQIERTKGLPAPRATLLDCRGQPLALDRPVMSVGCWVTVPRKYRPFPQEVRRFADELARQWASRLVHDREGRGAAGGIAAEEERLRHRLYRALKLGRMPDVAEVDPEHYPECKRGYVLVDPSIGSSVVLNSLRVLAASEAYRQLLILEEQPAWEREYFEREATWGPVGVLSAWQPEVQGVGLSGLEAWVERAGLQRGSEGEEAYRIDVDGRRTFWRGGGREPDAAPVVHTSLDLRLQADATRFLLDAATESTREGKDGDHGPTWGGLVLVDVLDGSIKAMASWHEGEDGASRGSLAPYQNVYEPGSIVKPLMMAWALQCGVLDWHREFDCTPHLAGRGWRHPDWKTRVVHDDHTCASLTPHGIIMNSSNIGAVQVGVLLNKAQWRQWMDFYQWGRSTGLGLPGEHRGSLPRVEDFANAKGRLLKEFTIPSLSMGYCINVTALQVARAYLALLHGGQRQLRLVTKVEDQKGVREVPVAEPGPRVLGETVTEAILGAMQAVVSDQEGATGRRHLLPLLREAGVPAGYVAGKSGTAVSTTGVLEDGEWTNINVRNASFVALAPAHAPRYLAVCVLQKERTERFYGGRYAAPAAGRLLLRALREDGVVFSGTEQVRVGYPESPAKTGGSR